ADDGTGTEAGRQKHRRSDRARPIPRSYRRGDEHADDEERSDGLVRRDDGESDEPSERDVSEPWAKTERRRDAVVERGGDERTVQYGRQHERGDQCAEQRGEIAPGDRENVAEEHDGRVGGEGSRMRNDDDAE